MARQLNQIDRERYALFMQHGPDRKCWHTACQSYRAIVALARKRGENIPMFWEVQSKAIANRNQRRPMPLPVDEIPEDYGELVQQLSDVSGRLENLTTMIGRGYEARRNAAQQQRQKEEEAQAPATGDQAMFRTSANG